MNRNWKKLTDSRKRGKILVDNRQYHHPFETLIVQLVEQRTGNAEVTGSNPVEALSYSCLPYLRLTVKNFQFLRLSTKFLAVLRLSVNPIETLTIVSCRLCHAIYYLFYKKKKKS